MTDLTQTLAIHEEGGVLVVYLECPRIDHSNFDELNSQLVQLLDSRRPERVLVNLRRVEYLHSLGIGLLSSMIRHIDSYGGELRLCSLQPDVHELLTITHMHNYFEVYETQKAALAGY